MPILAKAVGKARRKLCHTQLGTRHNDALGTMVLAETAGRFFITLFFPSSRRFYVYDFTESESVLAVCGTEAFFSSFSF